MILWPALTDGPPIPKDRLFELMVFEAIAAILKLAPRGFFSGPFCCDWLRRVHTDSEDNVLTDTEASRTGDFWKRLPLRIFEGERG